MMRLSIADAKTRVDLRKEIESRLKEQTKKISVAQKQKQQQQQQVVQGKKLGPGLSGPILTFNPPPSPLISTIPSPASSMTPQQFMVLQQQQIKLIQENQLKIIQAQSQSKAGMIVPPPLTGNLTPSRPSVIPPPVGMPSRLPPPPTSLSHIKPPSMATLPPPPTTTTPAFNAAANNAFTAHLQALKSALSSQIQQTLPPTPLKPGPGSTSTIPPSPIQHKPQFPTFASPITFTTKPQPQPLPTQPGQPPAEPKPST